MSHMLRAVLALTVCVASVGCCCGHRPWWRLCNNNCNGCGDSYYNDWNEGAPNCCESCDCYGNWTGTPAGYHGYHGGMSSDGMMSDGEVISDGPAVREPTPAPPKPAQASRQPRVRQTSRQQPVRATHTSSRKPALYPQAMRPNYGRNG